MAEAISCPHCDRKISLRAELSGRRVVCPHCKAPFVAPALDEAEGGAAAAPAPQAAGPESAGMDFLADLSGQKPGTGSPWSPGSTTGTATRTANRTTTRKKSKKPPVELFILGGLAAAVVVVVAVAVVVLSTGGDEKRSNGKKAEVDTKFGLTEPQRRQLFYDLIGAVNQFGTGDKCRKKWSEIQEVYKVNDSITAKILDEGFDNIDWRIPEYPTRDSRMNFKNWNAEKTQTGRYPMLNY